MATSGIERHGAGWRAVVRVNGELHRKAFPLGTPVATMHAWRDRTRLAYQDTPASRGSLEADVRTYLRAVAAMPTIRTRTMMLERWCDALGGHRLRSSITTAEVQVMLHRWLTEGDAVTRAATRKGGRRPERLSAQTVRHRRNALRHVWTVLDGPDAPNPVKRAAVPRVPMPVTRPRSLQAIGAVLATMPRSATRARLLLMAATGLPQKVVQQLEPSSFDPVSLTLLVPGRAKGRTTAPRVVPIAPVVADIWAEVVRLEAFGPFSTSSMRTSFRLAARHAVKDGLCTAADVDGLTPYDLRHAFGALIYRATGDQPTVARLLGHTDLRTTKRYTVAAHVDVDRSAVDRIGALLSTAMSPATASTERERL